MWEDAVCTQDVEIAGGPLEAASHHIPGLKYFIGTQSVLGGCGRLCVKLTKF